MRSWRKKREKRKHFEFEGLENNKVIEFDKFKMPVTVFNSKRLNQEIFARTICGRNLRPQIEMPDADILGFEYLEFEAFRIKRLVFEHFRDITKMIGREQWLRRKNVTSTAIQVDGYSLDAQLRKYTEYQDMTIVSEFSDEGFSGKNIKGRPKMSFYIKLKYNSTAKSILLLDRILKK